MVSPPTPPLHQFHSQAAVHPGRLLYVPSTFCFAIRFFILIISAMVHVALLRDIEAALHHMLIHIFWWLCTAAIRVIVIPTIQTTMAEHTHAIGWSATNV